MTGDTATANEVEDSGDTAAGPGERRPSLVTLQSMLKKVSHSPFHSQYKTFVSLPSDTSGSSANDSRNTQDVDFLGDLSAATSGVTDNNQESSSKGRLMEGVEVFSPPTTFQSSHLDLHPHLGTLENGSGFSETEKNLFQTSTNGNSHFHDAALNSPDLFKPVPAPRPPQRPSLPQSVSLFQAAKGDDLLHPEPSSGVNLFDISPHTNEDLFKSPSNKENDLLSQKSAAGNPFYTSTTNEADLFQAPLSPSEDPFPSPITRDLFQDFSTPADPFGSTPSKQFDAFQDVSNGTPDIFQPLPSNTNSKDVFEERPSSTATYSTPLSNGASEIKSDVQSPSDLVKAATPPIRPRSFNRPSDVALTTNQDSDDEILPSNPFTRARNLSMFPGQSRAQMSHVRTIRRPPKPLPRTRPTKPENPPTSEKPPRPPAPVNLAVPEPTVPKTSPPAKPPVRPAPPLKPKESSPTDPENHIFEDVLLIGQEKCVEDWPEDSPELNPNFKPSGTLRLRRESLKTKADSDGGSGEDPDGSGKKKRDKRNSMSRISRRGSKEKFADTAKERKSSTLPPSRKSSKEYFSDIFAGENEDEDSMDYKKKLLKTKVTQLIRRASTSSSMPQEKHADGRFPQDSKGDYASKKGLGKENSIIRRWSEGGVLDASSGEEEEEDEDGGKTMHQGKKKKKMKIKFVPQRGFAITVEKGAHGYTPRKGSKDMLQDEDLGAYGFTPRKKSQDDTFEDVEEIKAKKLATSKAALMDDEHLQKTLYSSAGYDEDEEPWDEEDLKPKKPPKPKLLHAGRLTSKEEMPSFLKKKSSFSAEELDEDELNRKDDGKAKTVKQKAPVPVPRKHKSVQSDASCFPQEDDFEEDFAKPGKDFMSPDEMYDSEEDELDSCKPKKPSKLNNLKKLKSRKSTQLEREDPPGAACGDFLSEAARAEWIAAKMDERTMVDEEEEDEDGDTDSLMEWWNTVEQWDELPSDEEQQEDESESFGVLADKVTQGLRVFNKIFMERAEALWHSVISLHAIADDISTFHHKAKIAGITGGTTTAVGGVAAIAGLALAPITFGASLVVTAVGVGVATAGGITSASAAISDNVNNMHDRKKVELVLEDYENHLLDLGKILHFVNHGLYKLRGHPFLRSGTQHYSEDWEIRRAVQMISLVDKPVQRATEITDEDIASVQGLFRGMDKYFIKDTRELKKGCKKEVVAQIKEVATILNDGIVELNALREELQDATGGV